MGITGIPNLSGGQEVSVSEADPESAEYRTWKEHGQQGGPPGHRADEALRD